MNNRPTLLLSMGFDSLAAWVYLGQPQAIYFDLGSRYSAPERARYELLRRRFPNAPLSPVNESLRWLASRERGETAFVPLRNLLLVSTLFALGIDEVLLAAVASDYGPDKRLSFTLATGLAARIALGPVGGRHRDGLSHGAFRVRRPVRHLTKSALLAEAARRWGGWDGWIDLAYSCYIGSDPPCGECRACRRAMFEVADAGAPHVLYRMPSGLTAEEIVQRYIPVLDRPTLVERWRYWRRVRRVVRYVSGR